MSSIVCRLTGRAVFRGTLLAKQGKLVLIKEQKLRCSVADLAEYVQQQVGDMTEDSLSAYNILSGFDMKCITLCD